MSVRAYRVFIISVLQFVAQLEDPPPHFDSVEATACRRLLPGPWLWMTPSVLHHLRSLGYPMDLANMHELAWAVEVRVFYKENRLQGGLQVTRRARELRQALNANTDLEQWQWLLSWQQQSFLFKLESAHSRFQEVVQERTLTDQLPEAYLQWRVEVAAGDFEGIRHCKLQATIREVLHQPSIASAVAHIRPKLDRIRSDVLPGQRVNLALSTLRGMLQSLAPRVASAYLRTICNGWITRTRFSGHQWFQHGGHCRFGCTECEDTLQHFAVRAPCQLEPCAVR